MKQALRACFTREIILLKLSKIITAFVAAAAIAAGIIGIASVRGGTSDKELQIAEDSVRRAAVTCYSIEGAYPPNYEYLRENYGLRIDESRIAVMYSVFASNLMPDITVIPLERN